ncbi:MAG: winged helix-turn-helix transcriptional regulator [Deltaproteobacteria bacterium]|nr:winged helix-turn-helix transcriptional regulator [Deltaproteobacteria bacterium]
MTQGTEKGGGESLAAAGELLRSLSRLNHAMERASRALERTAGVTAQQRVVIRWVGRFPGMTAGDLARQLSLDAGTVSAALGRLERRGLVERRRGKRDGRRVVLGLTAAGRAVDREVVGPVERSAELLAATIPPEALATAQRVIERLRDLVEAQGGRSPVGAEGG